MILERKKNISNFFFLKKKIFDKFYETLLNFWKITYNIVESFVIWFLEKHLEDNFFKTRLDKILLLKILWEKHYQTYS